VQRKIALLSQALTAALCAAFAVPPAIAFGEDWGLNGVYQATSNGDWSRTNDIFRDEISVRSRWTISTTCSTPVECTGRVVSDQGWSADVSLHGSEYVVKRDIPNWEPCPDGVARAGHQIYRFYPVDENGLVSWGSPILAGVDKTSGDSGACGINKALIIAMPFRLDKVG
jgi:hypothetical protein